MALETLISSHEYFPGAAMAPEPIPFPFLAPDELTITIVSASGVETQAMPATDYVLSGSGATGDGSITAARVFPAGARLLIERATVPRQKAVIKPQEPLPAKALEQQLDRQTMVVQDVQRDVQRLTERGWTVPRYTDASGLFPVVLPGNVPGFASGTGADAGLRTDLAADNGYGLVGGLGEQLSYPSRLTRTALSSIPQAFVASVGTVHLAEGGRQGAFVWYSGDQSANCAADPAQAFFVPPSFDTTGASGAWRRRDIHPINPRWFGILVDGSGTSNSAFANMAAWVNSQTRYPQGAVIELPPGRIRLSASVTFTNHVSFVGSGADQSIIQMEGATSQIILQGSRSHGGAWRNTRFTLTDMSIYTVGSPTVAPLFVNYTDQGTGTAGVNPTLIMDRCSISGSGASDGFHEGIRMTDTPFPKLTDVVIRGSNAKTSAFGIHYTGKDGSPSFTRVRIYYVDDAIYVEGTMEGVQLHDCEFVAIQRGLSYISDPTDVQPFLVVSACHINAEECCVKLSGITQFHIGNGSLFYAQGYQGAASTTAMVNIVPTGISGAADTIVLTGKISGVTFNGAGSYNANTTGIYFAGSIVGIENYTVTDCRFDSMQYGITCDTNSNGVRIDASVQFLNVVAPFTNGGNKNYREPTILTGSTVGVTIAGGFIDIEFPIKDNQFTAVPMVMASAGDGGNETHAIVHANTTVNGFRVQIANSSGGIASGQTRRVNWLAAGN